MTASALCLERRLAKSQTPFRSRGEAKLAKLFRRYGIPFLYEHPLLVYDRARYRIWHPDFMLPSYDGLIVEYAGMPDVPEYMAGIRRKEQVFHNHRYPAVFIYPWDLRGGHWPDRVIARIDDAYRAYRWRKCWAHVLEAPPTRGGRIEYEQSRHIKPRE